jgi:hypothetical protein
MNGGAEFSVWRLALRGGARYSRTLWHRSVGVGYNITPRFGVDFAAFENSANLEQIRRPSFALSLRLNHAGPIGSAL